MSAPVGAAFLTKGASIACTSASVSLAVPGAYPARPPRPFAAKILFLIASEAFCCFELWASTRRAALMPATNGAAIPATAASLPILPMNS